MILHRSTNRGFTILELIVAMGVTVLLVFMISALFTATSDGVSLGMAVSDVIGAGRAVGDQIERDGQEMIGPIDSPAGVFVIVCQKLQDIPYMERRVEKVRDVRSDQVMWFRFLGNSSNGFGSAPITPFNETTYSSPMKTQMGMTNIMRIWYGHGIKTNTSGTGTTAFGQPGANKLANQWAMCRHALFLRGDATAPNFNHSQGAHATASVQNMTRPGGGGNQLFHGTTDVAYMSYGGDPLLAPGAIIGTGSSGGVNPNTLWSDASQQDYAGKALNYMFIGNNRIWVNPFPRTDPADATTWATSSQVAQMHPLLMDNVSDFIVEFAADAVDTPSVTTKQPDGFDGTPDVDAAGETIWYGLADNAQSNTKGPPTWDLRGTPGVVSPVVSTGITGGGVAYVFRHGAGNEKLWPYMVRLRYRIHDARGDLLGDKSPEPEVGSQGTNVGRWFEQIIKVKRS